MVSYCSCAIFTRSVCKSISLVRLSVFFRTASSKAAVSPSVTSHRAYSFEAALMSALLALSRSEKALASVSARLFPALEAFVLVVGSVASGRIPSTAFL